MSIKKLLPLIALVIVVPGASFWAASAVSTGDMSPDNDGPAARLEPVSGENMPRVVLTADAAERIGIQTAPVRATSQLARMRGDQRTVIPYSAVLYDIDGDSWVYTNVEPLVFVRRRVSVDRIDGDDAVLQDGPPQGTTIVTVGAAELFGTEVFGD
jgi:hypothetical protein